MHRLTKIRSTLVASITTIAAIVALAPAAIAASGDGDAADTVTSVRAFPKTVDVDVNLLAEAVATEVEDDAGWDSYDELDVPQTESTAEREAREAKEAQAAQEAQEREAAAAASRSAAREQLNTQLAAIAPPNSTAAADLIAYAKQFIGKVPYRYGGNTTAGWDCSGFVQYVFSSVGISLPRTSGAQAQVGTFVGTDLSNAQPGDIIANASHAGIYLGNGVVINATKSHPNPAEDTAITPVAWAYQGGYQVRRVL